MQDDYLTRLTGRLPYICKKYTAEAGWSSRLSLSPLFHSKVCILSSLPYSSLLEMKFCGNFFLVFVLLWGFLNQPANRTRFKIVETAFTLSVKNEHFCICLHRGDVAFTPIRFHQKRCALLQLLNSTHMISQENRVASSKMKIICVDGWWGWTVTSTSKWNTYSTKWKWQ